MVFLKETQLAHSLSAKKRIRQNVKRRLRNRMAKSALRTQMKKLHAMLAGSDPAAAEAELRSTARRLDRTAAKGIIHPRTAARYKSRLARDLQKLQSGQSETANEPA